MTNALSDISAPGPAGPGLFEARYLAFLETVRDLRPKLHKYCARKTGSVLDGEDVVQDALFHAYRKLDSFDDSRPRAPWLSTSALWRMRRISRSIGSGRIRGVRRWVSSTGRRLW